MYVGGVRPPMMLKFCDARLFTVVVWVGSVEWHDGSDRLCGG